jgi:hypothetical protein
VHWGQTGSIMGTTAMSLELLRPRVQQPFDSRILVGAIGFEPTTPCAQGRCATRLRYAPT